MFSVADFLASAPVQSVTGSSPWATAYAATIRRAWERDAAQDDRTLQRHLGPSELGVECDRQVVGKLVGAPETNHVADPWPSTRGRALHTHAERVFARVNDAEGARFLTERKVHPIPGHSGTADLYDAVEQAVVDHKFLGPSSLATVKKGPPRKYRRQLFLYAWGYLQLGLPVRRTALVAYPAAASTLDGLYVHEWLFTTDTGQLTEEAASELSDTFDETVRRHSLAEDVLAGRRSLSSIPSHPDSRECYFCPFYRPQAAKDDGPGCPGALLVGA